MSDARATEILENYIATGWTAVNVAVSAGGEQTATVKATPGQLALLHVVTGAITVTPKNNTLAIWDAVASTADLNLTRTPIQFGTSLKLTFSGDGNAWVLYK